MQGKTSPSSKEKAYRTLMEYYLAKYRKVKKKEAKEYYLKMARYYSEKIERTE